MLDLAIIIVTWNVRDLAVQALQSLYADLATSGLTFRVIVVDSASSDDTVAAIQAQFPQVEMIASQDNLGFGKANNTGMRHLGLDDLAFTPIHDLTPQPPLHVWREGVTPPPFVRGGAGEGLPRAIYLLNPDTITQPGATRQLFDELFSAPDIGLTGAQLAYEDGSFQHGAFAFPGLRQLWVEFFPTPGRLIEGRFNGRYPQALYTAGQPFDVDFTLGATMMIRREALLQAGMFDENFFMYAEEVDLAWRIKKAGWRIVCVPTAHVTHLAGKSTSQVRARSLIYLWESRLKLFRKHYPAWKLALARRMVVMGMRRKMQQLTTDSRYSATERQDLLAAYQKICELALSDS